jgi:hypothetical protein
MPWNKKWCYKEVGSLESNRVFKNASQLFELRKLHIKIQEIKG